MVKVHAGLLTKGLGHGQIKVGTAQPVVAADGGDADYVFKPLHQGHVQGAAAQVEDETDPVIGALLDVGRQGSGGGLVDQPFHHQTGQCSGPLGGGPLGLGEIGGHTDDGLGDRFAQKTLRILPQPPQHQGRQLFGIELFFSQSEDLPGAHVALEAGDGPVRMGNQPLLGGLSHQNGTVLLHADHAGRQIGAGSIGNQLTAAVLPDGGQTVGGPQIDADDCHNHTPFPMYLVLS